MNKLLSWLGWHKAEHESKDIYVDIKELVGKKIASVEIREANPAQFCTDEMIVLRMTNGDVYKFETISLMKSVKSLVVKNDDGIPTKKEPKLKFVYTIDQLIALRELEEYRTLEIETLRKKHNEIINSGNVAKIKP